MKTGALAARYAQALFAAADEKGLTEEIGSQLAAILQEMETDGMFRSFMLDRSVPAPKKRKMIEETFGDKLHLYVRNFLFILFDKDREYVLAEIGAVYVRLLLERQNILPATLTTAVPVDDATVKELAAVLTQKYNKEIVFSLETDPKILGGAVIRVGDQMIDGSLKHQLAVMRNDLRKADLNAASIK